MRLLFCLILTAYLCIGFGQAQHCTVACPRTVPTLIAPKQQSTYVYSFESKTTLTPRDTQKVTINGDAEVSIVSGCEAVLHLKNVVIDGVPTAAELATELSAKPFAFGYFNGRVLGVCPASDEEDWASNIKKAIVSALQVQADEDKDKVDEMDFSGKCPTDYRKIYTKDGSTVMEKRKNLNLCDERRIDLRQTPDQALGQLKEILRHYVHPMDSSSNCRLTLKDQMVSMVDCEEKHVMIHRSHKPIHISNLKMNLKETKDGVAENLGATDAKPQQAYLSFDHKHKNPTESDVLEVLKKLCSEISEPTASIETSFTFQKLVDKLRYLSDDETASVDEAVKANVCPQAQKRIRELFLDASAFAASDGSIRTLVKANENDELSVTRSTTLFLVTALKAAPNKDTVQALLPVIASEKTIRPLLLGFSVLVRRYCEKTDDCATNPMVKDVREAYLARMATSKDENEKMNIVRALENLNMNTDGTENMINSLDEIIKSGDADVALRAAAVNALPNDANQMDRYKTLVMDEAMPNEVRIAAFQKMVKNNGMSNIKEMLAVKGDCVKNYVLTYVNNLKKSNNKIRRASLTEDVELSEQPKYEIGISRNIAREYGPYTFEYDIIYPEHDNATRSINMRVTRASNDKLRELVEIQLYQKGFDKEVTNGMNFLEKKSLQSGIQFLKDLIKMLAQIRKSHEHNHLKSSVKVNGKNIMFTDVFEDLHKIIDLLKKRAEKLADEKKVDRTIGGVLLDSKVVVPTITGLPMLYKFGDNFVLQYNGEFSGEKGDRHIKLDASLVAGLHGSMKLKVKDQKLGYEYDAKLAYTPHADLNVMKKDHSLAVRSNLKDLDQRTILKFKQSLREKRSTGEEKDYENELAPEGRSENCFSFFLMEYCRKASQIKGLILPNVEYYINKPEKEVTALELEFKGETEEGEKKVRRYVASLTAVGSPTEKQAKAQIEIVKGEEVRILLKSPGHEFNTKLTMSGDKNNLNMKFDLPNVINAELTGEFEHDKENGIRKNKFHLQYKMPSDEQAHTVDYENEFAFKFKRSSKEKNTQVFYKSKYESTHFPCLNHKTAIEFKYRPFKVMEMNLEAAFGKDMQHHYQLMRNTQIEVEEMKPFKMHGNSDIKWIMSDFDIDYDLKSEFKYESNKATPLMLDYKLTGQDRSKRATELGANEIEGSIDYKNAGSPIDSKMTAKLKHRGNQYGYESELKQTESQNYEGKMTLSKNDNKIFVTHKEEMTKPTDTFHMKSEAEVTYSYNDDKKNYFIEFKKDKDLYTLNSNVKLNGEVFYENDVSLQSKKLKWNYRRNQRSIDLSLDNVLNPREGDMMLKINDRIYAVNLKREPFKYHDIKVEGNEHAYIKKGDLHMSLVDPMTLSVLTKNDGQIDATVDFLKVGPKRASLKIDSKKYNLYHDGEVILTILSPRYQWKTYTRKDDREYKVEADLAPRSSLISFNRITPERKSNIRYTRQGDEIEMDIDTSFVEGKVDGTIKNGRINLKGRQTDFEIESTWRYEDGKILIEPVKSENGKLEGVLSRKVPSKLVLETPRVKLHMDYDRYAPVKMFKLDYESPNFEKNTLIEYQPQDHYKYHSSGKVKETGRSYSIHLDGKPQKSLTFDMDVMDFKLKVNKPEDSNKAQFSYTFNDYTETEEYEFDPHRAYIVNWLSAIRKYIQNFIVDEK